MPRIPMRTERFSFGSMMLRVLPGVPLVLCAAVLGRVGPLSAAEIEPQAVLQLDSPLDYQVVQRQTRTEGIVPIRGRAPAGTERVEVQLGGDWLPAELTQTDGAFVAKVRAASGGWYVCRVRATAKGQLLATAEVPHVGVGEVFVVAGQSNSANHGEEKLSTQTGLVAAFDGTRWQLARDPQPGASGGGGSFLPPLGDAIAERFQVPVGLVACGIGATSVREWLPKGALFPQPPTLVGRVQQLPSGQWESKGDAFAMFTARMKQLGPRGFRAVLWHQGESDANQKDPTRTLPGALYRQYLEQLLRDSRREIGWEAPWFVAQVSYHVPGDEASPDIRAAQASLWKDHIALEGPDSDALKGDLRERSGQGVHFSGEGLRVHAAKWGEKVAPWIEHELIALSAETRYDPKVLPKGHEYFELRDGLTNCRLKFEREKTGRIAFLGGSITAGGGWREHTMRYFQEKFPQTKFDFIGAGISSLGSVPHAFRLQRDVLSKGPVDLLFVEAAVNDSSNTDDAAHMLRGMEGVVRHMRRANPLTDIIHLHFVMPEHMTDYNHGNVPVSIAQHERVGVA